MKTPEGYEKDEIKAYLKSIGAYFVLPFMTGFGRSGAPDIIACIPQLPYSGAFWSIEVKREGKYPTALQEERMREVKAAGGMTAWGTAKKVIGEIETWRSVPPEI